MAGLIDEIIAWAPELKHWEQCVLDKLLRGVDFDGETYERLFYEFLCDAGIAARPAGAERIYFAGQDENGAEPAKCRLERLFNLEFVNALPGGQDLRFGPQLTLVFGENGAGKSGYARLLGQAAFARGERDVLPNARVDSEQGTPRANIEISWGERREVLSWTKGVQCRELCGFYVFDASSVHAHLANANSLSFAPSGLEVLTKLADATDVVRGCARDYVGRLTVAPNFAGWFTGTSAVTTFLDNLTAESKTEEIERQARFTHDDQTKIENLERCIAQLKAQDPSELLALRREELRDLERLSQAILLSSSGVGEAVRAEIEQLVVELAARREESRRLGTNQFKFDGLTQIGSEEWFRFVRAAKTLADAEGEKGSHPKTGDPCLLCRQPLAAGAASLITKLWEFLSSDAESRLDQTETACASKVRQLQHLELGFFLPDAAARRLLERELPVVVPAIEVHAEACSERRQQMIDSLTRAELIPFTPIPRLDAFDMETIIRARREAIAQLEGMDTTDRIQRLQQELRPLEHRRILSTHADEVKQYVRNLGLARKAEGSLGSTRHITAKYTELFKRTVTERYVELFLSTVRRFGCRMDVTIDTHGSKGETLRVVCLKESRYSVEQVLSEGEKMAVALADFLTEATLDESATGIILDDPVTSLDNKWKGLLAQCLAEHAKQRQVVVFTHDLAFLFRLVEQAAALGVNVVNNWIQEENGRPGFVYADNSPVCEKDYKSAGIARECYSKAKDKPPEEQQLWLQQGFGALRASYEALVIFDLFNGVVARFEERIRFEALKDVRIGAEDVAEITDRMAALSRHIDAHLHSDVFAASKPTPALLLQEIEAFESMRKKLKARRQAASTMKKPVVLDAVPAAISDSGTGSRLKAG